MHVLRILKQLLPLFTKRATLPTTDKSRTRKTHQKNALEKRTGKSSWRWCVEELPGVVLKA